MIAGSPRVGADRLASRQGRGSATGSVSRPWRRRSATGQMRRFRPLRCAGVYGSDRPNCGIGCTTSTLRLPACQA